MVDFPAGTAADLCDFVFAKSFDDMQQLVYKDNEQKGFHNYSMNELYVPTKLGLIVTEVAEAIEAHRTQKSCDDHLPEHSAIGCELADVVIRCMDLAEGLGIDLGQYIVDKITYNRTRAFKHGGKAY